MFESLFFLILLFLSLLLVVKSADFAILYSSRVARGLVLPKYIIGFLIVSVIGIMPEALISVSAAIKGLPSLGLGTLFGSNVADLTLIFALVLFISGRNLKVESRIIRNQLLYVLAIALPLILGLNGHYSRLEGFTLIAAGVLFYLLVLRENRADSTSRERFSLLDMLLLVLSMAGLVIGAQLTIKYGVSFASSLRLNPIIIGMFVVALGTTLPELFFSIRAARKKHDSLALGDILGIVVTDATVVLGLVAAINPFFFNKNIVYVTGVFMLLASIVLGYFMKTGKTLTKNEAYLLLLFYLTFVIAELAINATK